jgi:hypothetical protein
MCRKEQTIYKYRAFFKTAAGGRHPGKREKGKKGKEPATHSGPEKVGWLIR